MATKKKSAKKAAKSNMGYANPSKKKAAKKAVKKIARQENLPGMEDKAIKPLENKAFQYAGVRDERIGLSKQEGELKQELLGLMKKYEKTEYRHGTISITLVHEKENVRVKIKAAGEDDELSHEEADEEFPDEDIEISVGDPELVDA